MLSSSKLRQIPHTGLLLQLHQSAAWHECQMSLPQLKTIHTQLLNMVSSHKKKTIQNVSDKNKRVSKPHIINTAFSLFYIPLFSPMSFAFYIQL